MEISYIRLTGQELENMQKVSPLKVPQFAAKLGVSKSTYYNLTEMEMLPKEVQITVDNDPELSKWRSMLKPKEDEVGEVKKGFQDFMKGFTDIIAVMNKKEENHRLDIELHKEELTTIKQLVNQVVKNNDHYIEESRRRRKTA